MSTPAFNPDEDAERATQALVRAARRARELAERTGTPCYVLRDGCIVDIARKEPSPQPPAQNQGGTTEARKLPT
jgi:hypothetical protein